MQKQVFYVSFFPYLLSPSFSPFINLLFDDTLWILRHMKNAENSELTSEK
jgi:hypothetical protein